MSYAGDDVSYSSPKATRDALSHLLAANGYSDEDLAKPDRIRNLEMVLDDYCDMKSLEHFPKLQSVCLIQQDIRRIQGLDRCMELERLLLNENSIERIEGLQNCRKLQKLYLPFNCIQEIGTSLAGLVELKVLWLAANRLTSLQGLDAPNLTELNVASNRISSVEHAVDGMPCLQSLNLADNRLCSYREVIALSRLDSLRTLSFADPDFGENPICFLCNYQTYVLYHLPKLQVHDQMRVAPEAHAAAMNAFIKKRLFYNMRIKTLQRQASDCLRAAKVIDEDRRNVLARDLEAAARTLRRAWAFQQARAESPSMMETDPAEQQDLEAVEARLQQCQVEFADADAALEELKSEVSAEKSSQIRSLVLELHSGGNVRVEQGTDSTPWVAQIKDLVMSRFRHEDYEDYGITGLRVTGVSRIHHRSLRLQFDQILERVEPDADRAFEHLFYVPDPREDPQEIWEVVEAGLAARFASELAAAPLPSPIPEAQPASSESGDTAEMEEQHDHRFPDAGESRASNQWASAPTSPAAGGASRRVLLTNTLGLAEVGRLQNFAATSLGKATQRAVLRAQKSVATTSFTSEEHPYPLPARCGVVLLCQVRLGEQVHDSPGSFDPSSQDVYEQWKSRPSQLPAAREGVLPVCVDNPLPLRTFYRSLQSDDRIKVWHVPHVELILPEFLVEFEYIHGFEEIRKDALRVWMEFGPFACLLSKYAFFARMGVEDTTKRRKNKPATGQDVTQQLIAQDGPDNDSTPSHWPKALPELPAVPRLTNSVLLNPSLHITASNFASLHVLNLHGRCLRRIEANALDGLGSLRTLLLSFNCIESLGAIPPCETLTSLDVAHNLIQKVNAVVGFPALIDLDLSWNQLLSTETFGILARDTPRLESLVVLGNQLTREDWRTAALSKLVYLRMLDRKEVSTEEIKEATQRSRGRQIHLTEDILKRHAFAPPKRGSVEERRSPLPGELCYDPENDRVSKLLLSHSAHGARQPISSSNWKSQVAAVDLHGLGLSDLRGLAGLDACQTLCLDDNEVGTLDWLPPLQELEELSIERCGLLSLQGVSRCQELQKLDAGGNQLTDALELQKLTKLSHLSLEDNFVDSLDTFAQLHSLMELYLSNNLIEELRSVLLLKQLPKLAILDLSGNDLCKAPDYRQYTIFHLRKLKVLDGKAILRAELHKADEKFSGKVTMELLEDKLGPSASCYSFRTVDLSSQGIRELGQLINDDLFPSLRELILDGNPFSDIRNLGPLSKLLVLRMNKTKLDLENGMIGGADETHGGIATLPNLQVMEVGFSGIVELRFLSQLPLTTLRILHLPGNEITKIEGLSHMEQLRELVLDKNKIKQFEEKSFDGLKALRELRVEENGLKSLLHLGPLPRLRALYLSLNRIGEFGELDRLRPLKHLLVIHMAQNPVARKPQYRAQLLSCVPTARAVDGKEVTAEERERIEQLIQLSDNGKMNAVYVFNEPPPPTVQVTYMSAPLANIPAAAQEISRPGPSIVEPGRLEPHRRPSQAAEAEVGGGSKKQAADNRAQSAPRRGAEGSKGPGK